MAKRPRGLVGYVTPPGGRVGPGGLLSEEQREMSMEDAKLIYSAWKAEYEYGKLESATFAYLRHALNEGRALHIKLGYGGGITARFWYVPPVPVELLRAHPDKEVCEGKKPDVGRVVLAVRRDASTLEFDLNMSGNFVGIKNNFNRFLLDARSAYEALLQKEKVYTPYEIQLKLEGEYVPPFILVSIPANYAEWHARGHSWKPGKTPFDTPPRMAPLSPASRRPFLGLHSEYPKAYRTLRRGSLVAPFSDMC